MGGLSGGMKEGPGGARGHRRAEGRAKREKDRRAAGRLRQRVLSVHVQHPTT